MVIREVTHSKQTAPAMVQRLLCCLRELLFQFYQTQQKYVELLRVVVRFDHMEMAIEKLGYIGDGFCRTYDDGFGELLLLEECL